MDAKGASALMTSNTPRKIWSGGCLIIMEAFSCLEVVKLNGLKLCVLDPTKNLVTRKFIIYHGRKFICLYDKCSEFRSGLSKDIGSRLEYLGKKEGPSKRNPQDTDEKSYDKLYDADIIDYQNVNREKSPKGFSARRNFFSTLL